MGERLEGVLRGSGVDCDGPRLTNAVYEAAL